MKTIFLIFMIMLAGLAAYHQKNEPLVAKTEAAGEDPDQFQEDFKIYHDPGITKITVWHYSKEECKGRISIYLSDGRQLAEKDVTLNMRINTWVFDIPQNATGLIFVKLVTKSILRTAKIFKQR